MNPTCFSALAALALGSAFAPLHGAGAAPPDTVLGVASPHYDRDTTLKWTPERFVRIRNPLANPITLEPPARESVYVADADGNSTGYAYPWVYSVRTFVDGAPHIRIEAWGGTAMTLYGGDSADIGMFQMGMQAVPKRAASAPLVARNGEAVAVPVTIRYGNYRHQFILKTVIAHTVIGSGWVNGPALRGNRDTVFGVDRTHWEIDPVWQQANYIRVKNTGPRALTLNSIRFPSDSVVLPGSGLSPIEAVFAIRTYAGGVKIRSYWHEDLRWNPVTLAIGDSADIGMFHVGIIRVLVKESAARRYRFGETLIAPVTLFAGTDSLRFILKAKVLSVSAGGGIAPLGPLGTGTGAEGRATVAADGRRNGAPVSAQGIRFRAPAAAPASRPR